MNFYTLTSKGYDLLDVTYFAGKNKNPRIAINQMIQGEDVKILDMCCGTAANTIPIAKQHGNAKFLGIDLSRQMLQVAKRKIANIGLNHIHLRRMDATNTCLKSGCFDYIVIGLALHEMSPSLQRSILKEAYRVLKPDGRLLVLEWEKPQDMVQKILYFPLLVLEQILCKNFLNFYHCDKKQFFKDSSFEVCNIAHCSYSAVFELKKIKKC